MSSVSNLAPGTWEQAEAMVGETIAVVEGVDPVSAADIRRKLEVIGFDCPLHTDPDCARALGYADVISPASMVRVWAMPAYWRPGTPRIATEMMSTPIAATAVPGEGDTMMATGMRTEHFASLYPGDRVTATVVLKSITRKTTRVGPGAFMVVETTYRNQDDEVISVETVTLLRYQQQEEPTG